MDRKADTQLIKLMNEIKLLNLIRESGPISRVELAKISNISKVAVFEIINRLMDAGFVIDIGKGESTNRGGKKPSLIKLSPGNHYVIGIEFKRTEARIGLADIEAKIIDKRKISYEARAEPMSVIQKILRRIDQLLKSNKIDSEKLVSIGIGIPGLIDYKLGKIRFADTLRHWDEIPLTTIFENKYKIPTIIENDVNILALGESLLGAGKNYENLVCLWLGDGIGAGLILENRLWQGFGGSAGEIGYFELFDHLGKNELEFFPDTLKYYGDILSVSTLKTVIVDQIKQKFGDQFQTDSLKLLLQDSQPYSDLVQKIMDEYAALLSRLCLDIIKLINPDAIILTGKIIDYSKTLLYNIRDMIAQRTLDIPFISGSIIKGQLGEEAGLRGSIAMALQVIFETRMTQPLMKNQV